MDGVARSMVAKGEYFYKQITRHDLTLVKFDNMSEPGSRKLVAMGIACLVATGRREVLGRLNGEIFNLWLDVFGEIKEALEESTEDGNMYVSSARRFPCRSDTTWQHR